MMDSIQRTVAKVDKSSAGATVLFIQKQTPLSLLSKNNINFDSYVKYIK